MERVYQQAEHYYAGMLGDIRTAKHCIDLEVYIFANDDLGQRFVDALCVAAQQGIKVRLLIDGAGSGISGHKLLQPLVDAGVDARIYHPLPWRFWQWPFGVKKASIFSQFFYLLNFINRRNHRKVLMVDEHIVWLGSFNLCQQHLPQNRGGEGWRDTGVRLDSVNADELKIAFEAAWSRSQDKSSAIALTNIGSGQFRLNFTRRLRRAHRKGMLRHIGQAKHRLWVTNAYFIPSIKLLRAIQHAAARGVDVRLMVPAHSDVFFMPWATAQFYGQLLQAGVRIYEYHAGVLHAKTLVADHWVCVGSSNLNHRSWLHDLEVDAVLHEQQAVRAVEQQFLHDQLNAREVKSLHQVKMSLFKRCIGRLALLMRYWL